ncbi:MAG: FKBP-type peptidyl-prolyl cis-trans isomerase [Oligoflexales bacterium]
MKKALLYALPFVCLSACTCEKNQEAAQDSASQPAATSEATSSGEAAPAATTDASGLEITDITVGQGAEAVDGSQVTVHYTGTLTNGTTFDSSVSRNEPFVFELGKGHVIKGWEMGVKGMKVGGKRKLVIPPDLAYGERGAGSVIPPNATLVFEIELLDVK